MNARKLAAALRMAADALDEANDEGAPPAPRRPGKRPAYVPPGPIDEATAARARRALVKRGVIRP